MFEHLHLYYFLICGPLFPMYPHIQPAVVEVWTPPWEHCPVTPSQSSVPLATGALAEWSPPVLCARLPIGSGAEPDWLWSSESGLHPFPEPMTSSSLGVSTHSATSAATRCWKVHTSISNQTFSDPTPTSLRTSLFGCPRLLRQVPNRLPVCLQLFLTYALCPCPLQRSAHRKCSRHISTM